MFKNLLILLLVVCKIKNAKCYYSNKLNINLFNDNKCTILNSSRTIDFNCKSKQILNSKCCQSTAFKNNINISFYNSTKCIYYDKHYVNYNCIMNVNNYLGFIILGTLLIMLFCFFILSLNKKSQNTNTSINGNRSYVYGSI